MSNPKIHDVVERLRHQATPVDVYDSEYIDEYGDPEEYEDYDAPYEEEDYDWMDPEDFYKGEMILGLMGYDIPNMSDEEKLAILTKHPEYFKLTPKFDLWGRWVHVIRQTDVTKLEDAIRSFTSSNQEICVTDANEKEFWNFSEYRRFGLVFEGRCKVLWNADMFSEEEAGQLEAVESAKRHIDEMTEGWASMSDLKLVGLRVKEDEGVAKDAQEIQRVISDLGITWEQGEAVQKQLMGVEVIDFEEAQDFYEIPYDEGDLMSSENPEVLYEDLSGGGTQQDLMNGYLEEGINYGRVEQVRDALYNGANPNPKFGTYLTRVIDARMSGDIIRSLIDAGANVQNHLDEILNVIIFADNVEALQILFEYGFQNYFSELSENALLSSLRRVVDEHKATADGLYIFRELLNSGATFTENEPRAMQEVIEHDNLELLQLLLEHGYTLNDKFGAGRIMLQSLVSRGQSEVLSLLIEHDAVDLERWGGVALHEAVNRGDVDIVKLLLDNGADIHENDDVALLAAINKKNVEVLRLLLDKGADVHVDDDWPIIAAVADGDFDVVKTLLDYGASTVVRGKKLSDLSSTNEDLVPLLKQYEGGGEAKNKAASLKSLLGLKPKKARKNAMLGLDEAIERALLMSDDSLHLAEQSYELLVDKLAEEDIYSFTMGLTERGIMVRTSEAKRSKLSVEDKLVKAAQSYSKQSPGGVWMPDSWEDDTYDLQDEDLEDYPEDGEYESFLESNQFVWPHDQEAAPDIEGLRETLENAGIRITPDGKVEMYKAHIPGIYTNKLPQGPLPLDTAVKYFDQLLDSSDAEQTKLDGLLDLLTRLMSQTYDLEMSIEDLDNYKFSPASRSQSSQAISSGLEAVRGLIAEGNWNGAQRALDELRGTIDEYEGERYGAYDESLAVVDALDRLAELQASDPEGYQQAIEGLGGMPLAARRRAAYSPFEEVRDADEVSFVVSRGYLESLLEEANSLEPDEPMDLDTAQDILEGDTGSSRFKFYVSEDSQESVEAEAGFVKSERPSTFESPAETEYTYETYDLTHDPDFREFIWDIIFWS